MEWITPSSESPRRGFVSKARPMFTHPSVPLVLDDRAGHDGILSVARLNPGLSVAQGQTEMNTIQNRLDQLYPDANRDLGIYIEPLKQEILGDVGRTLLLLSGAGGLVLLIACANIASLLLA